MTKVQNYKSNFCYCCHFLQGFILPHSNQNVIESDIFHLKSDAMKKFRLKKTQ